MIHRNTITGEPDNNTRCEEQRDMTSKIDDSDCSLFRIAMYKTSDEQNNKTTSL